MDVNSIADVGELVRKLRVRKREDFMPTAPGMSSLFDLAEEAADTIEFLKADNKRLRLKLLDCLEYSWDADKVCAFVRGALDPTLVKDAEHD